MTLLHGRRAEYAAAASEPQPAVRGTGKTVSMVGVPDLTWALSLSRSATKETPHRHANPSLGRYDL